MTIEVLHERGCSNREIARQLGVDEKAVRYRLRKLAEGKPDGRVDKPFAAEAHDTVIRHWLERSGSRGGVNLQALHEHLVAEHGYPGSYKSVQRYVRAKFPRPKLRTRRRVETPPGAQGQVDWGEFPGVVVRGEALDLHAFHLVLSHSRMEAIVWSSGVLEAMPPARGDNGSSSGVVLLAATSRPEILDPALLRPVTPL